MFKRKRIFVIIIALLLIWGGVKIVSHFEAEVAAKQDLQIVSVVQVTRNNLSKNITLSAEFKPYQEADLHAKVAGYLKAINFDIGDQVKIGQVIAKIDIDELKADLDRATAAYHNAKLDYDRVSVVIKKSPGLLAQEEVDKAQAAYEIAKANMERAKTFLDYATISAPFDGIITKRFVDVGAMINPSQTLPIVHLAETDKLRLDFSVPESAVPYIHVGTKVAVKIDATGQIINTQVARSTGKINDSTHTMRSEVEIENKDSRITSGMYATVQIILENKDNALVLPVQAVSSGASPDVLLVNQNNEIEKRSVKIGMQTPDYIEIISWLNEGDKVIFGSRGSLEIGAKVTPKLFKQKED